MSHFLISSVSPTQASPKNGKVMSNFGQRGATSIFQSDILFYAGHLLQSMALYPEMTKSSNHNWISTNNLPLWRTIVLPIGLPPLVPNFSFF